MRPQNTVCHCIGKFVVPIALLLGGPRAAHAECRERLEDALRRDGLSVAEGSDHTTEQVVDAAVTLRRTSRADFVFFAGRTGWHAVAPFASHRQVRRAAASSPGVAAGWCALEAIHAEYRSARGARAGVFATIAALCWLAFTAALWRLRGAQKPK